jgi:hypothetical protein
MSIYVQKPNLRIFVPLIFSNLLSLFHSNLFLILHMLSSSLHMGPAIFSFSLFTQATHMKANTTDGIMLDQANRYASP